MHSLDSCLRSDLNSAIVLSSPHRFSNRLDALFKRAMELEKFAALHLRQEGRGPIWILFGASSSGKTTIISQLRKKNKWKEGGWDRAQYAHYALIIYQMAPLLYLRMAKAMKKREIAYAILTDTEHFKADISPQVKADAQKAIAAAKNIKEEVWQRGSAARDFIQQKMVEEAINYSLKARAFILDLPSPAVFLQYCAFRNFSAPVKIALVYCPFHRLLDRVIKRNRNARERGDKGDLRYPLLPLLQFAKLYKAAKPGESVIETLFWKEVEATFEKAFVLSMASFPQEREAAARYYRESKEELREKLGFSTSESVGITPRFQKFDFLFNTHLMKPIEIGSFITKEKQDRA